MKLNDLASIGHEVDKISNLASDIWSWLPTSNTKILKQDMPEIGYILQEVAQFLVVLNEHPVSKGGVYHVLMELRQRQEELDAQGDSRERFWGEEE